MASTVNDVRRVGDRSPWRVLIKDMGPGRGPNNTIATICDAKNVGGSLMYNAAGEAHFTLPNDHVDLHLIVPRKVHYVIQQHDATPEPTGGAWRDVFVGLVIDKDATDDETVFYGMDYLAMLSSILDERVTTDAPELPPPTGSKYVNWTIGNLIADQLQRAVSLVDSPVGFIAVGAIAAMPEVVNLYTSMKTVIETVVGLMDSHRQGSGKRTRLSVRNIAGTYTFVIEDNPGVNLPNLRLGYGELVQGYIVTPFTTAWANLAHGIGRKHDGLKVMYDTEVAPGVSTAEWGRWAKAQAYLDLDDDNDLKRRTKQAAYDSGLIGQKVGLAFRANALRALDGYDILDRVPVEIIHGGVDTRDYLPWWSILGVVWEGSDDGNTNLTLTLLPYTDLTPTDPGIAGSKPYPPFGGSLGTPDGLGTDYHRGDHAHAIGERIIGDGTTVTFLTAQEFEPNTVEADVDGVQLDIVEGSTYDVITFAIPPPIYAAVRLDYLAVLNAHA